jgi:hypothetical protein
MNPAVWVGLGGLASVLLVLLGVGVATLLAARRSRAREAEALSSARADVESLRSRVDDLCTELAASKDAATVVPSRAEYLITGAGEPAGALLPGRDLVPERAVLSVTLGEPLVKLAAFGYALRKTLSPESRNRISFQVRREVKRARKERRRLARRTRLSTADTEENAA